MLIFVCAAVSGCSSSFPHVAATTSRPQRHGPATINLASLPRRLPKVIRKRIPAVVNVDLALGGPEHLKSSEFPHSVAVGGSGVILGPHLVLTAGHVFSSPLVSSPKSDETLCRRTIVESETRHPTGYLANNEAAYGAISPVNHLEFNFGGAGSFLEPDAALVHTFGRALVPLGSIQVARRTPRAGARLYFINYESSPGTAMRDPYTRDLNSAQLRAGMSKPVVFGGFSLGRSQHMIQVIENLQGYSVSRERVLLPGGSGGAVLNSAGRLVGISVQGGPTPTRPAPRNWELNFSVHFTHVPRGYRPDLAEVQWVTTRTIHRIEHLKVTSGHC